MSGDLLAQDGDVQIGDDIDGILLRGVLNSSTQPLKGSGISAGWVMNNFNPWIAPEYTSHDTPYMFKPGSASGYDVPLSRKLEFDVYWQQAADTTTLSGRMRALWKATRLKTNIVENEISWQLDGVQYAIYGRFRGVDIEPSLLGRRQLKAHIRFLATDPYIYDLAQIDINIPPYTAQQSSPNIVPPTTGTSGVQTVVNWQGDGPVRWGLTMTSPWVNPCFMDITTGNMLWFNNNGVITAPPDSSVVVGGMRFNTTGVTYTVSGIYHTVFTATGSNRRNELSVISNWMLFDPHQVASNTLLYMPDVRLSNTPVTTGWVIASYTGSSCTLSYYKSYLYI